MKKLKYLVIHCTATPANREVTVEDIRRWHLSPPPAGRGWRQVGYSNIIHNDGKIERLVDYNCDEWVQNSEITNGAVGYNSVSRHIVYVGGLDKNTLKPKNTLTVDQFEALEGYIVEFLKVHPDAIVCGHNQIASKACPCFNVYTVFGKVIPEKNRMK